MNIDVEQVILTALRTDLLNEFDSGILVFDPEVVARRSQLHAEHALDAVLARGVSLNDVLALLGDEPIEDGRFDHVYMDDIYAGANDPRPFPPEFEGLTLGAFKRQMALDGLAAASSAMSSLGARAVAREVDERMAAMNLDPKTTPIVQVMSFEEWRELYAGAMSAPLHKLLGEFKAGEHE